MKIRTDVIRMYKEIHGWVGIISGLALFIAFYAGAITMFEEPLQRWATPPSSLADPVSLERAPELIEAVLERHPEAAKSYDIHIETGPEQPARLSWTVRGPRGSDVQPQTYYAALAPDGSLQIEQQAPSAVAQFVDVLHQQVGLPFAHEISMPIMGAISLLYAIAIVSGVIVLLPSLVSDLFAMRIGKNVKRMWLDLHNVLGLLSLPFHIVMALTAVVFAFHDQFYDLQHATFSARPDRPQVEEVGHQPAVESRTPLTPVQMAERIEAQAPGFRLRSLNFADEPDEGLHVHFSGIDPRYGARSPVAGGGEADAYSGELTDTEFMPGRQDAWAATITSFFTLHFGSFGGDGIRWSYFLLGIAGAFLFYTGNLLWIESRRKRERKAGAVEQTRSTRILAALTIGVPLGCVAGISATVAAAKPFGLAATAEMHSAIYYAVFLAFTGWALMRGAPRAAMELVPAAALTTLLVPLASVFTSGSHPVSVPMVDLIAVVAVLSLMAMWHRARSRAKAGPRDSVWAVRPEAA